MALPNAQPRPRPAIGRKRVETGQKTCVECGGAFERRPLERPKAFMNRTHCAFACFLRGAKRESREGQSAAAAAVLCRHCGDPVPNQKPSHAAKRRYCSLACSYAAMKTRNPARQPCVVCGGPCDAKRRMPGQRTCSAKCAYERRKARLRSQRQCNQCGVSYWPGTGNRTKFCSRKCYAATQATQPSFVVATCTNCRVEFRRNRKRLGLAERVFCGTACARTFLRGEHHHSYRGDKDPNRGAKWNRLADSIRHRDCYSCRRCGLCETGNGQKLSVDHIRPWRTFSDKTAANHPDNLASLCRPCHSYKTTVVEAAWLRGDVLAWKQWVASLNLQSAVKFGWSA